MSRPGCPAGSHCSATVAKSLGFGHIPGLWAVPGACDRTACVVSSRCDSSAAPRARRTATLRHRCGKTEAAGPFRTWHASTRRECIAAPRFFPRLARQAPPGPTTSALQAPAVAPVDPYKRFGATTSALQPPAVAPAAPFKRRGPATLALQTPAVVHAVPFNRLAALGRRICLAMRPGPFPSRATGAATRSGSWGWAGLGTRSAAPMRRVHRPVACARVPSPARPRGLGLAAAIPGLAVAVLGLATAIPGLATANLGLAVAMPGSQELAA